jgi:hypothetical protein
MTSFSSKAEVENTEFFSCTPECVECREYLSDPKKIPGTITNLQENLRDLPNDNQQSVESWLVDFKELELLLLKYGPSSTKRKCILTASRFKIHIFSTTFWTAEVAMIQLFAIKHILDLYGLCKASQVIAVSSLRLHALSISRPYFDAILDLVKRATPEVGKALEAIHAESTLEVDKATLREKLAQSSCPLSWALVKVYGQHLLKTCLSFVFLIHLEGAN